MKSVTRLASAIAVAAAVSVGLAGAAINKATTAGRVTAIIVNERLGF